MQDYRELTQALEELHRALVLAQDQTDELSYMAES